jgi:hypothetical protein
MDDGAKNNGHPPIHKPHRTILIIIKNQVVLKDYDNQTLSEAGKGKPA